MTMATDISKLDDAAVLRVLSAVTEQLRAQLPQTATASVNGADEAREAVSQLLQQAGSHAPQEVLPDEGSHAAQARALLQLMLQDPETRAVVQPLIDHPPDDEQRSVELALAGAVILGGLVTWLETKVEIDVERKGGKINFRFHLKKEAAGDSLIHSLAKQVAGLL
jgi:hypothetical protein